MKQVHLILEDGSIFKANSFGAEIDCIAEVVFHTGLTGYQEIISDPSYYREMVCMTYPLIGNYGINRDDYESIRPYVSALLVKEYCDHPQNWRSQMSLSSVLKEFNIPGLEGIDTRRLTRIIRNHGSMKAKIAFGKYDLNQILNELKVDLANDHVAQVSTTSILNIPGDGKRVVVMDFGCKRGIIKELRKRNCDIVIVPWNTKASELKKWQADGVLLSNGPGDPRVLTDVVEEVKLICQNYPSFGICLGHQLIGLSFGAQVERLKFGHHGANHPVQDLDTGRTYITSQNHNYAVIEESLKNTNLIKSHMALNDRSIEGLRHTKLNVFSVQYHPEANPGPEDSSYLFDEFLNRMEKN